VARLTSVWFTQESRYARRMEQALFQRIRNPRNANAAATRSAGADAPRSAELRVTGMPSLCCSEVPDRLAFGVERRQVLDRGDDPSQAFCLGLLGPIESGVKTSPGGSH
jgi:hypothetical protein